MEALSQRVMEAPFYLGQHFDQETGLTPTMDEEIVRSRRLVGGKLRLSHRNG